MSAIDLVRLSVATAASLGGAVGGFSASLAPQPVVSVVAAKPPMLHTELRRTTLVSVDADFQRWQDAFQAEATATLAPQAELQPWLFVGVVGDGRAARAVFSSPTPGTAQTIMAKAGDTLPDGRVIAAVASSNVLFAAPTVQGPLARALAAAGAPQRLALFGGGDVNAPVTQAYEQATKDLGLAPGANAAAPGAAPAPIAVAAAPRPPLFAEPGHDAGYAPPGVPPPASAPGMPQ